MSFKPITVNTEAEAAAHIYSQDDAAIYQCIFGSDGVFNIGNKFSASILSNNIIRVSDGVLCVGGHIGRLEYADYQDMTIENGTSGYDRNDIIYAKFMTSGDVDTFSLMVKKGKPTNGTAADPSLTQGNLYQGETEREYPLWRVKLSGLSIISVESIFTVIPTIPELQKKITELSSDIKKQFDDINDNFFQMTGKSLQVLGDTDTAKLSITYSMYGNLAIIHYTLYVYISYENTFLSLGIADSIKKQMTTNIVEYFNVDGSIPENIPRMTIYNDTKEVVIRNTPIGIYSGYILC